jgi:hypothetical protein
MQAIAVWGSLIPGEAGIRTAMNQRIRHLVDDAFLDAACAIEINVTNYSAHVSKTVYRIFKIPNQQNEQ